MNFIPAAHKISNDNRLLRDALRTRLKIVQRHTSITNSMHLFLAKYNLDSPKQLNGIPKFQFEQLSKVESLLKEQMLDLEKQLYPFLIHGTKEVWLPAWLAYRYYWQYLFLLKQLMLFQWTFRF